jgi:hypothetical protein
VKVERRGGETTLRGRLPASVRIVRVERFDEGTGLVDAIVECEHPSEALAELPDGLLCAVCGSRGRELPSARASVRWDPG